MVAEVVDRRETNLESGAEALLNAGAGVGVSVAGNGSGGCDRSPGRATLASATSNTSGRPHAGRRFRPIKMLNQSTILDALKNLLFDFVIFDRVIRYQATRGSRVEDHGNSFCAASGTSEIANSTIEDRWAFARDLE
jgi:hypothetical protein